MKLSNLLHWGQRFSYMGWMVSAILWSVPLQASLLDFANWSRQEIQTIEQNNIQEAEKNIRKKTFQEVNELLDQGSLVTDSSFKVEMLQEYIYTRIVEPFHGDYKEASKLYVDVTLGKRSPNLFIESGAGESEELKIIRNGLFDAEYVSDRVYTSKLAFNTKTTTELKWFDIPEKKAIVVINELVKDWGQELAPMKKKKMSKPYGPVYYDVTIDVYQKKNGNGLIYHSFSMFKGQGMKSTSTSFNMAKKVGNIFSLGTLDRGLGIIVEREGRAIWTQRKELIQKLLEHEKR